MKISYLRELGYHVLADIAELRIQEYLERNPGDFSADEPDTNYFVWDSTPETGNFWVKLSYSQPSVRDLDAAMLMRPDLFVIGYTHKEDDTYSVKTNGLFS